MPLGVWGPRSTVQIQKPTTTALAAPANDWIKIKIVDDQTGKAVAGVELDLKVTGGLIEQHETPYSGLIESLGLKPGDCEVSGDVKDLTLKNTLLFVGVGDKPIEKSKEGAKADEHSRSGAE